MKQQFLIFLVLFLTTYWIESGIHRLAVLGDQTDGGGLQKQSETLKQMSCWIPDCPSPSVQPRLTSISAVCRIRNSAHSSVTV